VFGVYFNNISVKGMEKIPVKGPVILAVNHPAAFTEACLLATLSKRPLHYLVRGDVFVNKFVNFLLAQTNQTPIYRFRDGFSKLRDNEKTFSNCYEKLDSGKILLIFCEGNTKMEKRLRSLQKGLARIAFGAYKSKGIENLPIVPIGVNYSKEAKMGEDVMINVGEIINVKDYVLTFNSSEKKGILELTGAVEEEMRKLVVDIQSGKEEDFFEELIPIIRRKDRKDPYRLEKNLASKINNGLNGDILNKITESLNKIKSSGLDYRSFTDQNTLSLLVKLTFYFPVMITSLCLILLYLPVFGAARLFVKLAKAKPEFESGIYMAVLIVIGLSYLILLAIIGLLLWSWWGLLVCATVLVLKKSIHFVNYYLKLISKLEFSNFPSEKKSELLNDIGNMDRILVNLTS
jgi:1-acyl-sn-glycerol-3-phosphate acyltransferase